MHQYEITYKHTYINKFRFVRFELCLYQLHLKPNAFLSWTNFNMLAKFVRLDNVKHDNSARSFVADDHPQNEADSDASIQYLGADITNGTVNGLEV